jgi:phosphatidylglycerol:prolipoprotein diacylglycerol transferase
MDSMHSVGSVRDRARLREGGMSARGGLISVMIAVAIYARHRAAASRMFSTMAPLPAIGLFAGRIGNFINGELWASRRTALGHAGERKVLHPSQLYEAAFEGIVLFAALWWFTSKPRPRLAPAGLFLTLYAIFRFAVEFVRVPDEHIGYLAFGWLTMGQLLSLPVLAAGIGMLAWAFRRREPSGNYA